MGPKKPSDKPSVVVWKSKDAAAAGSSAPKANNANNSVNQTVGVMINDTTPTPNSTSKNVNKASNTKITYKVP